MPTMKNGAIELKEVKIPEVPMQPGSSFNIAVSVLNHNAVVVNDPDGCSQPDTPCSGQDGLCVSLGVTPPSGTTQFFNECVNIAYWGIPPNQEVYVYGLQAPSTEGTHTLSVNAFSTVQDEETGPLSAEINVSSDASPPPSDGVYKPDAPSYEEVPEGDGFDGTGTNDPDAGDPDNPDNTGGSVDFQTALIAGVIIVGVIYALSEMEDGK